MICVYFLDVNGRFQLLVSFSGGVFLVHNPFSYLLSHDTNKSRNQNVAYTRFSKDYLNFDVFRECHFRFGSNDFFLGKSSCSLKFGIICRRPDIRILKITTVRRGQCTDRQRIALYIYQIHVQKNNMNETFVLKYH